MSFVQPHSQQLFQSMFIDDVAEILFFLRHDQPPEVLQQIGLFLYEKPLQPAINA